MRRVFSSLTRAVSWHRRGLAAVAAAVAVLALWSAVRPAAPATRAVVVARHTLVAGAPLTEADIELRALPLTALPDRAVQDVGAVLGRTAAAGLTTGSVLTEASVVAPRTHSRPGVVTAPVRVRDADVLALLHPGDRVDVLSTDTDGRATVIARSAVVVVVPQAGDGGAFGSDKADLLLVEVGDAEASRVAAAGGQEVTVMLR